MIECPHSLYFFREDVTNTFDLNTAVNTLKDWFLVPLSRPVIAPPKQKLQTINIPGANGVLDLRNSLTRYPVFENRTGNIKFAVLNDKPGHDWLTVYTKILKFLQGNNVKMIMEDDPKYFYEGRVYVDDWDSKADGTWSEISLGYDLQPYRRSIISSIGDWLWDPFNFETDMVTDTTFGNIEVDSEDWDEHDFTGLVDMMPVIPDFTVTGEVYAQLYNTDLKKNWTNVNKGAALRNGQIYDCILCEVTPESEIKMRFKGHGNVSLDFRSGRL
jgi:hypothetical protein